MVESRVARGRSRRRAAGLLSLAVGVLGVSQLPVAPAASQEVATLIESTVEVNRGDPNVLDVGDELLLRFAQPVYPDPQRDPLHLTVIVDGQVRRVDLAYLDDNVDDTIWKVRVSGTPSVALRFPVQLHQMAGVGGAAGVYPMTLGGDVTLDGVPGTIDPPPLPPDRAPYVLEAAMHVNEGSTGLIDVGDRLTVTFDERMLDTEEALLVVSAGGATYEIDCRQQRCSFDDLRYRLELDVLTTNDRAIPLPATLTQVLRATDVANNLAIVEQSGPYYITFGDEPFPCCMTAPSAVSATSGAPGALTVTWVRPDRDGGSPITSYEVHLDRAPFDVVDAGDRAYTGIAPDRRELVLDELPEGATYRVEVSAVNAVGRATSGDVTVTIASTPTTTTTQPPAPSEPSGYWMLGANGTVYSFGDAEHFGNADVGDRTAVDIEATPTGGGYWVVDDGGRVYAFGDAQHHGDVAAMPDGETVTSLSSSRTGNGYWLFSNIGRAMRFGDASGHGDMTKVPLNGPVLDSTRTPAGRGYWMVASDGGVFSFGDATFHGSMGGLPLNGPVMSLAGDPDRSGYWLVATDGGIFSFTAPFHGSMGGQHLNAPVVGMVPFGNGYLMVAADGGIFNFSDRPFHGSLGDDPPLWPVVSVAALG